MSTPDAFLSLPKFERQNYRAAFTRLARAAVGDERAVPLEGMMNLSRCLNLTFTTTQLAEALKPFGRPHPTAAETSDPVFTWPQVVAFYNATAPQQPQWSVPYIQLFQMLDASNSGSVPIGDLKHVLTSLGDCLSEHEFQHLLYRHGLVERERIDVYDFMRLLMSVDVNGSPV